MKEKELTNFYESLTDYYKGKYENEEKKSEALFYLIMGYVESVDIKCRKNMLEELLYIVQNNKSGE